MTLPGQKTGGKRARPKTLRSCVPLGRPNPLSVAISPDTTTAATGLIGPTGGTLSATGADGTKFTLTVPADALAGPAQVTMTPIASIARLPGHSSLVAGVVLAPEGLQLDHPASLDIQSSALSAIPSANRQPFGFYGSGANFYFRPSLGGQSIELFHFSGAGVVAASTSDRAAMGKHMPSPADAAALQDLSDIVGASQYISQVTGNDPAINEDAMVAFLQAWAVDSVLPELRSALGTSDPTVAEEAIRAYIRWLRVVQTLGLEKRLANTNSALRDVLRRVLGIGQVEAYQKCTQLHDVPAVKDLLRFYRDRALIAMEPDEASLKTQLDGCLQFELQFRYTSIGVNDGSDTSGTDNWKISLQTDVQLRVDWSQGGPTIYGSAPLTYTSATDNPAYLNGTVTFAGASTTKPLEAVLRLNLNQPGAAPDLLMTTGVTVENWATHVNTDPPEDYNQTTTNYADSFFSTNQAELDAAMAAGLSIDESDYTAFNYLFSLGSPGRGVYARLALDRTHLFDFGGGSTGTDQEITTITILHTPLSG